MKRAILTSLVAALAVLATAPASASADFGFKTLDVSFTGPDGSPVNLQAGSHPFAMTTILEVNSSVDPELGEMPDGEVKDLKVELPAGFIGDPAATQVCSTADFLTKIPAAKEITANCPDGTAVGAIRVRLIDNDGVTFYAPVFNLQPPPGVAAKLGFVVGLVPVTIEGGVSPEFPNNLLATITGISQARQFLASELVLWGNPSDERHDPYRGSCVSVGENDGDFPVDGAHNIESRGICKASMSRKPFLTLPRSCADPLVTVFKANSWQNPAIEVGGEAETFGINGCSKLDFAPSIAAQATTERAESPSGLNFNLDIEDQGITAVDGLADSEIKRAVVTLPAGVTVNPSIAEGLATCTRDDFNRETAFSAPGEGCPNASKIGSVRAETPLLDGEHPFDGSVYVAQQDDPGTTEPGKENPFDSLIAIYLVIKDPELGVLVKLAGKVEPNEENGPNAGRLVTTFDDVPQLPVSHFTLKLREGGRSPLITPAGCGTYTTVAELTPWANPGKPVTPSSSFRVTRGVGGGPCPPAGAPPFDPGFEAGTLNNNAGSYSPVHMRITRADGEQDMTKFSSVLPPGLLGKLAGIGKCSDAAIAAARSKTGRQELADPSCPASSQLGRVLAGAGVGSQLTYVGGKIYLAGPYNGSPLSVAVITPAVAGPFDAGTVMVRVALDLNPRTAQAEVNGANSDPIPHILKGIVLKVRDLRVYADRPDFIINPTSCDPSQVKATLWGSFLDVFNPADDVPVGLAARFQAANCARLPFKPSLSFHLKGGTKRGGHPALRAVLRPRPGDANLSKAVVRLPRSAFLDQAHIRTVCTRVQFAADNCPPGSIYGHVRAFSPLLDEPLEGPAYLRSSDNLLPDLVFALRGIVEIEQAARIDSIKGGIRATFPSVPDAPISKVVVNMQGGKKGLIVNSRDLCAGPSRANLDFSAQNGLRRKFLSLVRPSNCGKQSRRQKGGKG
ncbi:MAG TPA: hypothetical protein VNP96_03540 [Solirubrobacterales bacterium]|nr:hypothetical protein [Solirubrobacterales bacterium]